MKHIGKKVAIIAVILIVVAGILGTLELTDTTHFFHKTPENLGTPGAINYGPPTQVEKNDSEAHKDPSTTTSTTPDTTPTSTANKKQVSVSITTYDQRDGVVSVNGFVSGVVEDGGTCTLTLTAVSNGKQATSTRTAIANATNTSCGASTIPVSKLFAGDWQATLSYSSSTSIGKSSPTTIEVK